MRLWIFTLCFLAISSLPPVFKVGVYKLPEGRWVFSTPYAIVFLIIGFLFIHEFIHAMSHEKHESSHDESSHDKAKGKKEKPNS